MDHSLSLSVRPTFVTTWNWNFWTWIHEYINNFGNNQIYQKLLRFEGSLCANIEVLVLNNYRFSNKTTKLIPFLVYKHEKLCWNVRFHDSSLSSVSQHKILCFKSIITVLTRWLLRYKVLRVGFNVISELFVCLEQLPVCCVGVLFWFLQESEALLLWIQIF